MSMSIFTDYSEDSDDSDNSNLNVATNEGIQFAIFF